MDQNRTNRPQKNYQDGQVQAMQNGGFTLMELLIVVAIIGILAAIAIPQYIKFTAKSKRAEGILALKGFHITEMSYFSSENTFPGVSPPFGEWPASIGFEMTSPWKYYTVGGITPTLYQINSDDGGSEEPGDGYTLTIHGQLDRDVTEDRICISYPTNENCCIQWGACGDPGLPIIDPDSNDILQ